ncbi:MAG: hypothetical protein ACXU9C_07055 [Xanthobacteraceae bacterium]
MAPVDGSHNLGAVEVHPKLAGIFMRQILFGSLFILAALASQAMAAENNALHLNRAQSVINAFQVICTLETLKFDRIDQKATAMGMRLQADTSGPSAGNTVTRSKSWFSALTDGPFILLLDEMSGAKAMSTSCAIVADVPDRDAFRAEAIRTMKLSDAPAPEFRADGSRSYFWDGALGPGTTILDRDFASTGKPGVMLKLVVTVGPAL